jgi:hypothetical protein
MEHRSYISRCRIFIYTWIHTKTYQRNDMRTLFITIAILFGVLTSSAQEMKSTIEERLTKYIPILNPTPCSVFLVDYESTEGTVKMWAGKLGLRQVETMYPDDTTQYILQYVDHENPNIVYGFIFKKKSKMYIGTYVFIVFKDHFTAIEELEKLKTKFYFGWDNDTREKTNAKKNCQTDGSTRFITVNRTNNNLMITTICLNLMMR